MKKSEYLAPAVTTTKVRAHLLNTPSITKVDGDTGVSLADPDDEIPGTAQSRRVDIWADEEEEEDLY